jgi:crotonobetainyl-CoA:carnitine CoA-transferase CaiB-like acyl-CoA transferase
MGALFHRERTGEATTVDVSLLGTGMWAMGQAFALSLVSNVPWQGPPSNAPRLNPLGAELPDQGRARRSPSAACRPAGTGPRLC